MIKVPEAGYQYPLSPKIEESVPPDGFIKLEVAVDALGKDMFPTRWSGDERGYFKTGYGGQSFRSKIEYETDCAFRDAVLLAQCELASEIDGGDPQQRFNFFKTVPDDNEPLITWGDLPALSVQQKKEVEKRLSAKFKKALAVRQRREDVESVFLLQFLRAGTLTASYVAIDGQVTAFAPHAWETDIGRRSFECGWIELETNDGKSTIRPILIKERELLEHLSSSLPAKSLSKSKTSDSAKPLGPRYSKAKVRNWYQAYVKGMEKSATIPSRDQDWSAACEHFEIQIPRSFVRELRGEHAPKSWKVKGRRRSDRTN